MANRREREEQWGQIVSLLERCRKSVTLSLAEAQHLYDAASAVTLPSALVRSVVAQAVQTRCEHLQWWARPWLSSLVFSADAALWADARWLEPPRLIGIVGERIGGDVATVVRSDDVDTAWVTGGRPSCGWDGGQSATDPAVYDVWPDWRDVGRMEFRRVHQGTVLSDVYLDGRGLSPQDVATQQELWCGDADHEWEDRPRNRGN